MPGMTVHQAKGREWPVTGVRFTKSQIERLAGGLLEKNPDDRLLYVALTRARRAVRLVERAAPLVPRWIGSAGAVLVEVAIEVWIDRPDTSLNHVGSQNAHGLVDNLACTSNPHRLARTDTKFVTDRDRHSHQPSGRPLRCWGP